jgi:homoserine/homoserine lactone efflux protein
MNWNLWWIYALTCIAADLTPGPAVMLVISNAAKYGTRRTVATICGSLLANIFYFAICATSVGAVLLSSTNLFLAVKWIGAAYLVYLGIRSLLFPEVRWQSRQSPRR